jgi:hypothetical protein
MTINTLARYGPQTPWPSPFSYLNLLPVRYSITVEAREISIGREQENEYDFSKTAGGLRYNHKGYFHQETKKGVLIDSYA